MQDIQIEDALRDIRAVAYTIDAMAGSTDLTTENAESFLLLKRALIASAANIEKAMNANSRA